jgi:hypothetical protein
MVALRWPDGVVKCPRCGSENVEYLSNAKIYKCYEKHAQCKFSLKVGTIFEDSPISLSKWLPVMWMLSNCKNGISSYEIHRAIGVTQKTAWFMLQRARLAMQGGGEKLSGHVEADETFVGGNVRNMPRNSKRTIQAKNDANWGKTVVLGLLEREGRVLAAVAPTRKYYEVHKHVTESVEEGSKLYTDEYQAYKNLPPAMFAHEIVNKMEGYVRDRVVHVNGMENCSLCNNKKRNRFPVNGTRAVGPDDDLALEEPGLLNPYDDADINSHIEFVTDEKDEKLFGVPERWTIPGRVISRSLGTG